jgi:hypothetical protein
MIIKTLTASTIIALALSGQGCASASAKLESKRDYRASQVQAIKVQREADVIAQQSLSAERVAMWNALSKAASSDKSGVVGTHLAIVAAVASSRSDSGTVTTGSVTTLTPEREVLPIDYVKALAGPLLTSATAVGISAITNETTRASINANKSVRMAEVGVDGQIIGAINNAIDELDDDELANQSSGTTVVVEDVVDDVVDDVTSDTATDTTSDDDSTVVDDTSDDDSASPDDDSTTSYYNDTASDCATGETLTQTSWGLQCQ